MGPLGSVPITSTNIRFASLGIRGFHALWLSFQRILLAQQFSKTLCQVMVALASKTELWQVRTLSWLFVVSQPFLNIRLPTYLLAHKWAGKNLKSLGYSSFARHYFRNRCLLSLPLGTKMFQFPRFPLQCLFNSAKSDPTWLGPGFPIRISSVQSLFGSSPKLFAAYYVLHRYLASRHPLCALE